MDRQRGEEQMRWGRGWGWGGEGGVGVEVGAWVIPHRRCSRKVRPLVGGLERNICFCIRKNLGGNEVGREDLVSREGGGVFAFWMVFHKYY